MPHYTNTSGATAPFQGVDYAANGVAMTWGYVWPIPDGFELTSYADPNGDAQAPWITLHNAVIGAGATLEDLEQYDRVVIYNGSGAAINLVANEASSHPLVMADGTTQTYVQPKDRKDLSKIVITGSGSAAINITAWSD